MGLSVARLPTPQGPWSVSGAPYLPDGFTGTFTSRYAGTGDLRQHVVTGGAGPPLLLVHGWPQAWYAWRLVMPGLARGLQIVVPDQRGCGLSGKPAGGYDTATLAADLAALMDMLGHPRFAVAGHDAGMWIGYALAADHPSRVGSLAVAEAAMPACPPHRPCPAPRRPTTGCGTSRSTGSPTSASSSSPDGKTSPSGSSSPRPPRHCLPES
jgi:pimeloyl-ACP methyl ester carboxylesterase